MARPRQGRSLTEDVYDALRVQILHGHIASGTRLHLGELAAARGVSLGVVREAVTRLASERLLDATPQAGFSVRTLSADHLADLTWARCQIEGLTVRESVVNGDTNWEAELVAAHHMLRVTVPQVDGVVSTAWMVAHRSFHRALTAGCPNITMLELRQQLFDEAEMYRHWSAIARGARRDVEGEHSDLLNAALGRHAERAAELVQEHLRQTAKLVLARPAARATRVRAARR
jgi:DNA-binding GntR family transcriptional regulator